MTIGVGIVIAHDAESARGVAPRAAHRSGRESLDSSGSCHPPKAAAFCQGKEFLRLPVDPNSTWMTCPLRSVGITPLLHYYETVRPCPADQYFRPRGASACAFSLSTADRFSSSVPEPGMESRHLCTGHHMASKQISAMLIPRAEGTLRFRCRLLIRCDAFSVVHLCLSIHSSHDVFYSRLLTMTFTTAAFDRSSSWLFEACFCKPASKGLPSSPAQHHAPTSAFLTQPRADPCERIARIRLLPRMFGVEAQSGIRVAGAFPAMFFDYFCNGIKKIAGIKLPRIGESCGDFQIESPRATSLTIIVENARSWRSFGAWDCTQVFVNRADIVVTHVLVRVPRHDLQEIAVERLRKAVSGHGRGARRVGVIQIHSCPQNLQKLGERAPSFGEPGFVRG